MIVSHLFELLDEVKDKMQVKDVKIIKRFIEKEEWGLAFETLCTQVHAYNIQIPCKFYESVSSFGKLIRVHPSVWLPLENLIILRK